GDDRGSDFGRAGGRYGDAVYRPAYRHAAPGGARSLPVQRLSRSGGAPGPAAHPAIPGIAAAPGLTGPPPATTAPAHRTGAPGPGLPVQRLAAATPSAADGHGAGGTLPVQRQAAGPAPARAGTAAAAPGRVRNGPVATSAEALAVQRLRSSLASAPAPSAPALPVQRREAPAATAPPPPSPERSRGGPGPSFEPAALTNAQVSLLAQRLVASKPTRTALAYALAGPLVEPLGQRLSEDRRARESVAEMLFEPLLRHLGKRGRLDELARMLLNPMSRLLRVELRQDRERIGRLRDARR
ncbi:hypothetical protein AB0C60_15260, partial [Streptomyces sp. NPDC048845]